mgnify:CR=1 FL=1
MKMRIYVVTRFISFFILYYEQTQEARNMNEFEKDPQEKTNDIPHAVTGFVSSFVFFVLIFAIGATISFIN